MNNYNIFNHIDLLYEIMLVTDSSSILQLIQTNKLINKYANNKSLWLTKIKKTFDIYVIIYPIYCKMYINLEKAYNKSHKLLIHNIFFHIQDFIQLQLILPKKIYDEMQPKECNEIFNLGYSYTNILTNKYYPAYLSYEDYDAIISDKEAISILTKLLFYYPNTIYFNYPYVN